MAPRRKGNDVVLFVRITEELRDAIERERQRWSKEIGFEVTTAEMVRQLLDKTTR